MRLYTLIAVVAAIIMLSACGSSGSSSTLTPGPTPSITIEVSTANRLFDKQKLTAPARAHVTIRLSNQDPDPHNIAIYNNRAAEQQIFVSDTIAGHGTTTTGEFDAPPPGTYFFRCDVHPVTMVGEFVVE